MDKVAAIFVASFLAFGIITLNHFGLSWDEGLWDIFYGERYLKFFITLDRNYLDFQEEIIAPANRLDPFPYAQTEAYYTQPPLEDILSAATMYVFSYGLKWLNPIDGFHLFTVFISAVFLWYLYHCVKIRLGSIVAFLSIFFLATFPRFWADMHFNIKDVSEMVFFGLTVISFVGWYEHSTRLRALLTGFLFGCALGVKANAIFIPLVCLFAAMPWSLKGGDWKVFASVFKWKHCLIMGVVAISIYFLVWPLLWQDPITTLQKYWIFTLALGLDMSNVKTPDSLLQVVGTTPAILLLLAIAGLFFSFQKVLQKKDFFHKIVILWFLIPIVRASVPGAVNFNGIRHFLEFVPAACILAAIIPGKMAVLDARKKILFPVSALMLFLIMLNTTVIWVRYFPFMHLYYNEFVGNIRGAKNIFGEREVTDYWVTTYRKGVEWVNANAPFGSKIYASSANHILQISSPVLLRRDIKVLDKPDFTSDYGKMFVFFASDGLADNESKRYISGFVPVHQIVVDGVAIMRLYQL